MLMSLPQLPLKGYKPLAKAVDAYALSAEVSRFIHCQRTVQAESITHEHVY